MKKKKKSEKSENRGQSKLLFWHLDLQPLGNFSHVAIYRSSLSNIGKMNIQPILNKNSPRGHMESKFDVLGVDV
jgi:hypothetical protein